MVEGEVAFHDERKHDGLRKLVVGGEGSQQTINLSCGDASANRVMLGDRGEVVEGAVAVRQFMMTGEKHDGLSGVELFEVMLVCRRTVYSCVERSEESWDRRATSEF